MKLITYDAFNRITRLYIEKITSFLYENIEEIKPTKSAIRTAIEYSAKERPGFGGKIFALEENDKILGAAVVNKTGMNGYIPENILVYIAVSKDNKVQHLRKKLLQIADRDCKGELAIQLEPDNPSTYVYQTINP